VNPNAVRIERSGNRILLDSAVPTPGLKNSIPGAYFRDRQEVWSLPLDLGICHMLRERFGNRLVIGPGLLEWARAEKAKRARLDALAGAADADLVRLPEVAPKLFAATSTRTYQRSGIRFIVEAHGRDGRRRTLLGDTVGLGKSMQAIGAMLESGQPGPYLVVCPKTPVTATWVPEIRKWIGDEVEIVTLPDGKAKRENILNNLVSRDAASLRNTWVVLHPEIVRTQTWWECGEIEELPNGEKQRCGYRTKYKSGRIDELDCGHEKERGTKTIHEHAFPQLFEIEWGGIVADESDQSLIRLTGTPNLRRRGMEMLRDNVRPEGIRLAMSGTPWRSKPHQVWSTLNWLDPVRWSSKWSFLGKYWKLGGYSGYTVGDFIEGREEMLIDELRDVMCRRERADVRADLPPKNYPSNVDPETSGLVPGIYLPMTPAQERAYRAIQKEGEARIEGGTLNPIGVLAELVRLKQFAAAPGRLNAAGEFEPLAEGNKFDWITNFLEELGFPDRPATKLVIASQFTKLLEVFKAGVDRQFKNKIGSGMITGNVAGHRRDSNIDQFEDYDSGLDLLWINTKAGGSSITLDAADIMVVLDETWVDDEQQQLEGRIDNREPERKIVPRSYYYLRSSGSLEESIARANAEARARGEKILSGAAIARRAQEGKL
jgi:Zierdtviridae DNA helicase